MRLLRALRAIAATKKGTLPETSLITRPRNDTAGAILIGVLIILLTVSFIGATLASFFFSVTTVAEVELARAQALYLAEAGVAQMIYQMRQASSMGGIAEQRLGPVQFGAGEFKVSNDPISGLITSTGTVRSVRRTIQVKYMPF